jgi:cholesterol transport system auxiliary component
VTIRPPHLPASAIIAVASLLSLLAGCGGILSGPPVRQLYRLDPIFAFKAPLPHVGLQVLVATPSAATGLDTARIALSRMPVTLDYFADAEWTDLRADFVLETTIRDFEAVYESPGGPPRAVVALHVQLIRMPARSIVAQTDVRREQSAAANAIGEVVNAFDAALGAAAVDIATWTVGNPALSERRGR